MSNEYKDWQAEEIKELETKLAQVTEDYQDLDSMFTTMTAMKREAISKVERLEKIGQRILVAHKQSLVDWPAMRDLEAALDKED